MTFQACIQDAEESLRDIIREIDLCLAKDHALILVRTRAKVGLLLCNRREADPYSVIETRSLRTSSAH